MDNNGETRGKDPVSLHPWTASLPKASALPTPTFHRFTAETGKESSVGSALSYQSLKITGRSTLGARPALEGIVAACQS